MQKRAPFEPQPVDYETLGTPDSREDDATPVTSWNPDFRGRAGVLRLFSESWQIMYLI